MISGSSFEGEAAAVPGRIARIEPGKGSHGGGGQSVGPSRSIYATALDGWMTLGEVAEEVDPVLANVVLATGLLTRAAMEAQADELAYHIADVLKRAELQPAAVDRIVEVLKADLLPFPFHEAVRLYNDAISHLDRPNRELLEEAPDRFVSAAMSVAADVIAGDFDEAAARSADLTQVKFSLPQVDSDGEWRILATLERPSLIPEQASIWCLTPKRRRVGDRLMIQEATYGGQVFLTKFRARIKPGAVVSESRNLDDEHPVGYLAAILPKGPTTKAYAIRLVIEGRPGAGFANKIASYEKEISQVVQTAAGVAAGLAGTVGNFPATVALGLLSGLTPLVINGLTSKLVQLLGEAILPTWIVLHTASLGPDGRPIALVLIGSPDLPRAFLLSGRLVAGTGLLEVNGDYTKRHLVDFWVRGRYLQGPSQTPSTFGYPSGVFDAVGRHAQPVVVQDSHEISNAARVFVPHLSAPWRAGSRSPAYVSAIRIETYWADLSNPVR